MRGRFDFRKVCRGLVDLREIRFDLHKACMRLLNVWRVSFDFRKRVGGL